MDSYLLGGIICFLIGFVGCFIYSAIADRGCAHYGFEVAAFTLFGGACCGFMLSLLVLAFCALFIW